MDKGLIVSIYYVKKLDLQMEKLLVKAYVSYEGNSWVQL